MIAGRDDGVRGVDARSGLYLSGECLMLVCVAPTPWYVEVIPTAR